MATEAFFAGGTAGSTGILFTQPFDVLKVRQQVNGESMLLNARNIIKNESVLGLWKGLMSPCLTSGAMNAVLFLSYETAMTAPGMKEDQISHHVGAGVVSGGMSVLLTSPTELVKCRAQASHSIGCSWRDEVAIAKNILHNNGVRGMFKGGALTALRDCPSFAIYFGTYEYIVQKFKWSAFAAGGFAGVMSWAFVVPVDTLKTNWQVNTDQSLTFSRFLSSQLLTYRNLFRGMAPCLLRAWPQHAITFSIYENLKGITGHMPAYDINGLTVHFPHEAYPCQVDYMGKVIEGLEGCKNVLLESPTGTGKTLSLLCGVLGWVTQAVKNNEGTQNGPPPTKVFYSSRTHAQLKQVIKEFRRTEYGKVGGDLEVTMTVLGSRDQLCIHPRAEGSSSTSKNAICTSLRQNRKCRFYNKLDEFMEQGGLKKVIDDEVEKNKNKKKQHKVLLDIEDLTSAGQTHGFCPFYYSRKMMSSVSVVFAPYNYLVDPRLRKQIGIDLSDAILIVDEAHNIASNTAEASSFSINTLNITEAVNELSRARVAVTSDTDLPVGEASTRIKDYDLLSGILKKLAHHLEMSLLKAKPSGRNDTPNITSHGSDVITLIKEQTSVTTESLQEFLKVMEACVSDIAKASVASGTKADTPGVEKLSTFLNGVFSLSKESLDESYKMVIFKEKPDKKHVKHNVQPPTQLGVWCMDASVAMRKMMEGCTETDLEKRPPRSLIITSGTLRPLDFFAAELGLDFPVRLQNPHVISESQIMTMAIRQGDNGAALNSKFANRSNPMYIKALGISVAKIVSMVPHGLLVFFQSFTFMNEMMEAWKKPGTYDDSHSIYDIISNRKFIIQEPPQTSLAPTKIQEYCSIIDEGNGAVMFAVFRGKMAEGMDFPDKYARGVALVGIPYANIGELKVTLKMSHLEEKRNRNKGSANGNTIVSGSNWYTLDALRSINQAVGRVIRHSKDYGTVFFLDERYDSKGLQVQLPAWVGHNMVTHTTIDDSFVNNVRGFYNRNGLVFSTVSKGRQHVKPVTKLSHNDGGRKRSLEADKATENAFNHARRYQELRDAQNPGVKKARLEQGIASASVSSFSSTDFKAPVETPPGKSLQIGAVDYASKYTLQEYKKSVKKTLSAEQYDIWKALLVEFAQQIDTASVFMKDRFVPWVVIAFTPKNADLLRCHVVTLPPAIRKEYLQLLKAHLKLVSKG